MPLRRLFLAVLVLGMLGATGATHDRSPQLSGEDWWIRPDPPSADQDLDITYTGTSPDITSATYTLDDGTPVKIDLTKNRRTRIPASALRGKRVLVLDAHDGTERGNLTIRFPSPR